MLLFTGLYYSDTYILWRVTTIDYFPIKFVYEDCYHGDVSEFAIIERCLVTYPSTTERS
jgi:hypothetical protein